MIEKILQSYLDSHYPNRDITVLKANGIFFVTVNDTAIASFSLKGTYRYEEVKELNKHTGGYARYGFCLGDGPTALIGVPIKDGELPFIIDASPYGEFPYTHRMKFNQYSDEDAKQVANYTVYGLNGIETLPSTIKFDKIHYTYDARYYEAVISRKQRVLKMNAKFDDEQYSYKECKYFASHQPYFAFDHSIAFAKLEDGRHVAIPGFSYARKDEALGFRDVWESHCDEPPTLGITFMTDKEAVYFDDFELYIYDYSYLCSPELVPRLAKVDRTFARYFDFCKTPDGKDMRLTGNF